jgi:hypothetical protein
MFTCVVDRVTLRRDSILIALKMPVVSVRSSWHAITLAEIIGTADRDLVSPVSQTDPVMSGSVT